MNIRFFSRQPGIFACLCALIFALTACGGGKMSDGELQAIDGSGLPQLGAAAADISLDLAERRVGIVYSGASAENFYDEIAYNQLFAAMQYHTTQAGLRFDLLDESDLTDSNGLLNYSLLLIPSLTHVDQTRRDAIVNSLVQARQAGVAMVVSDDLMLSNERGKVFRDNYAAMESVLGLRANSWLNSIATAVKISNNPHPVTTDYVAGDELVSYDRLWFANYIPTANQPVVKLLDLSTHRGDFVGAQAYQLDSRIVHFSNPQIMADHDLLAAAIEWAVYGGRAPVSLLPSRFDSVFLARNDMDEAMQASQLINTEIPLLPIIADWKQRYNFVGSYYLDIGNSPELGQFTDWSVSGPLYQDYMALGSEIGTHSWTHPHFTSELTAEGLEFEFNQSRLELNSRLGIEVIGGAVPGNPENMFVIENLNQWFDYFSGRSGNVGVGFLNATGYLEPEHKMRYFSLNMSPDFTLIDFLGFTPEQATTIWREEFDTLTAHARLPVLHWLWHDYGPTTATDSGQYSYEMFDDTLAYAHAKGTEFLTLAEYHHRLSVLNSSSISMGKGDLINVEVVAAESQQPEEAGLMGTFALRMASGSAIASVDNWYAWNESEVFLPQDGGTFSIEPGLTPADVTRITALPMRAKLLSLAGNGTELTFSLRGEGKVTLQLNSALLDNVRVEGAASVSTEGLLLEVQLTGDTEHVVSISALEALNTAPLATAQQLAAVSEVALPVLLSGTDAEDDVLVFEIVTAPLNGALSGTAPNLSYLSNQRFTGSDSFTFRVGDGQRFSDPVAVTLQVNADLLDNQAPEAFGDVFETLMDESLSIALRASDFEGQALTYSVVTEPGNGQLQGSPPQVIYVPQTGFTGTDSFEFIASDGELGSAIARVAIAVNDDPSDVEGSESRPLQNTLLLDGNLNDWTAIDPLGSDEEDQSLPDNRIDWDTLWMGHTAEKLYVAYSNFGAIGSTWGQQIYIDTDGDIATGFRGFANNFPLGAELLLEANSLLSFTGAEGVQNEWSWEFVSVLPAGISQQSLEIEVDRELLGPTSVISAFLYGNNAAVEGDSIDLYPQAALDPAVPLVRRRISYTFNENPQQGNQVPVAFSQTLASSQNSSLQIALSGEDRDGDALEFSLLTLPANGSIDGEPPLLSYQPDSDFTGQDSFRFEVSDGLSTGGSATIMINVRAQPEGNQPPIANPQQLSVIASAALPINLTASDADGDVLFYVIDSGPQNGSVSGTPPAISYQAQEGFTGSDTIRFHVNDGQVDSAIAEIAISVLDSPVNTLPVANAMSLTTAFETAVSFQLAGSDGDGDLLAFELLSEPVLGRLTGTLPDLIYTPLNGAEGTDSFEFRVSDGIANSVAATVRLRVAGPSPANRAPLASDLVLQGAEGTPVAVLLAGTDAEGDTLTYAVVDLPERGLLSGAAPHLTFTPEQGFSGTDSFTYRVNDGLLDSQKATVTLNIGAAESFSISNSVQSISIDASLLDWSGLTAFAADADDVNGPSNPLDWRQFWMSNSASNLYLAFVNDGAFTPSWGHAMLLDTDADSSTGFKGFSGEYAVGADVLVENNLIYAYTGTGTDWGWNFVGSASVATEGSVQEMAIPLSLLDSGNEIRMVLTANNAAFGGFAIDLYPDDAANRLAPLEQRVLTYRMGL